MEVASVQSNYKYYHRKLDQNLPLENKQTHTDEGLSNKASGSLAAVKAPGICRIMSGKLRVRSWIWPWGLPISGTPLLPPLFFFYFLECPQSHHGHAQLPPDRRNSPKGRESCLCGVLPCIWGTDFWHTQSTPVYVSVYCQLTLRVKRWRSSDIKLEVLKLSLKNNAQLVRFLRCASFHPVNT